MRRLPSLVAIAVICCAVSVPLCIWLVTSAAARAVGGLEGAVKGLVSSTSTTSFREYLTRVTASQGDVLVVATVECDEELARENSREVAGLSLGSTVAAVRAPTTYHYYVKISDRWSVTVDGNVCRVSSPPLRALFPPAIDTRGLRKQVDQGWARFDGTEALDTLERELSGELIARAVSPEKLAFAEPEARKAIERFARAWLATVKDAPPASVIEVTFGPRVQPVPRQ